MGIGLSLNPADVWKVFSEKNQRNKAQVADWLDAVAIEARKLADVWKGISVDLLAAENEGPKARERVAKELWNKYADFEPNTPYFYRLKKFYANASSVLGGRGGSTLIDVLSGSAGTILQEREKTINIYDFFLKRYRPRLISEVEFFNTANSDKDLNDLASIVKAMDREAAALEVIAINFRASV